MSGSNLRTAVMRGESQKIREILTLNPSLVNDIGLVRS